MAVTQKELEEALGVIWNRREQGIKEQARIKQVLEKGIEEPEHRVAGEVMETLLSQKMVLLEAGEVKLEKKGEEIARQITRRHRLAERLLHDVLEIKENEVDKSACEFEHILSEEVTDSICTLLGHPRFCPHNSPIPEGECCRKVKEQVSPIAVTLDKLSPGDKAKILYLNMAEHNQLHKLLSLGIIPGKIIHLHQNYPAYVLKVEETQIALEESLAKSIFLRKV